MPPNATTKKFIRKPIQMMRRALRNPHTSAMQSLRMYETGKTITPAVKGNGPTCRIFVPSKLEATRQTQNNIPINMKDTLTVLFFFIVLVFYEVYQALGC